MINLCHSTNIQKFSQRCSLTLTLKSKDDYWNVPGKKIYYFMLTAMYMEMLDINVLVEQVFR